MKQDIIKHIISIEKDLYDISKYLYENPEESFCEHKAHDYLINILRNNNFEIKENFLDIPTAFMAKFGNGHPKICYICEYDCGCKKGHIVGSNLVSTMSIGAAIGLSKVIPKTGGTVIVLGCPGEFLGGSKVIMSKQGVFDDIDVVLTAHPSIMNANCCSSPAVLPININYDCTKKSQCEKSRSFTPFDACLFTLNSINTIVKGYSKNCGIDKISINGSLARVIEPNTITTKFYIKAPNMCIAEEIKNKISTIANHLDELMNIKATVTLPEVPCEDFKCNKNLTRIFSHNLKEAGIIDIHEDINLPYGLSLGNVCSLVPTLKYLVKISENDSIKFASEDFAKETLSEFARNKVLDVSKALALTGFDLIDNEDLLREIKEETLEC
ncbi:amidohydrolase [Clostridium botulinum]|uniref:Peptidase M20 domain-containing protein 2 n=1 Tax=Clostridium botulinum TaxID=1491 RepID=A0A9Q1UZ72_CLOBO|nr:amidohydrolase [Clostridium botulinum]AEB77148.1 putative amidohydrolase [Clostridium botulinum BKT015925]KEI00574.1 amidohydrolase [Clostridium botulinum C/D str. Sp77]KEI00615.1 amidohydrolase [Clostridium botulinum D str. 16868]KLU75484.1 amidohydrolase [Clostridium botulinum V891]KOA74748.1 amidohydrolase [Clostridium botulinum]